MQARANYLFAASRKVIVREDVNLELTPAVWAYLTPIAAVGMGVLFSFFASQTSKTAVYTLYGAFTVFCFAGAVWIFAEACRSRLIVTAKEIVYVVGKKRVRVPLDSVEEVSIYRFYIRINLPKRQVPQSVFLSGEQVVLIPVSFKSVEIALAVLGMASKNNKAAGSRKILPDLHA